MIRAAIHDGIQPDSRVVDLAAFTFLHGSVYVLTLIDVLWSSLRQDFRPGESSYSGESEEAFSSGGALRGRPLGRRGRCNAS